MQNQSNKRLHMPETTDATPVSKKLSDGSSTDSYEVKPQVTAIYCRLSTEDINKINKGDDSESIQNQKKLLTDYAKSQDFYIYKVYIDDDYSGLDSNRPQFNQMLADAKAGLFNIILCKTQSRFTRDMELVEKYIHGRFNIWGIRFISVVDHVDTSIAGNKKARQIYGLINEWYCEDLSENIRAVFRQKMESGQFIGSFASYGYSKDPHNRHMLKIDPIAAEVVKKIYSLYLQGYGYQAIACKLTEEGIPTPTSYKVMSGLAFKNPNAQIYNDGKTVLWSNNTIRRILTNPLYIGHLVQGREKKLSYKSKKTITLPKEQWIIVENNHSAIISKADYDMVQQLIAGKRVASHNADSHTSRAYPLAGKVKCLMCGNGMQKAAPTRDKKSFYLRCGRHAKTRGYECQPNYISYDVVYTSITKSLYRHIGKLLSDKKNTKRLKASLDIANENELKLTKIQQKIKNLNNRINELNNMTATAYIDKVRGIITESDFIHLKSRIKDDINALTLQVNNHNRECALLTSQKTHSDPMQYFSTCGFEELSKESPNIIINCFVKKVQISTDEIVIHWIF